MSVALKKDPEKHVQRRFPEKQDIQIQGQENLYGKESFEGWVGVQKRVIKKVFVSGRNGVCKVSEKRKTHSM